MFKFVYIINTPGYTPETYNATYKNYDSITWIVGTDNIDQAVEYAANMAKEGFECFNLCGDFDDNMKEAIQKAVGEDVKLRNAKYAFGEETKVAALDVFERYGVIAVTPGVTVPIVLELENPDLYTKVWLVADQEQANSAAASLAKDNIHDIELCSWFTEERTLPIIEAVGSHSIPVGTCGI